MFRVASFLTSTSSNTGTMLLRRYCQERHDTKKNSLESKKIPPRGRKKFSRECPSKCSLEPEHAMFPKDNRLKDNQSRSNRRRRYEKNLVLQKMAKVLAEEEREVDLKDEFDRFIDQSKEKQTFLDFKVKLSSKIEQPSNHIVTGKFLLPFLASFCFVCLMYHSISLSLSLYLISL